MTDYLNYDHPPEPLVVTTSVFCQSAGDSCKTLPLVIVQSMVLDTMPCTSMLLIVRLLDVNLDPGVPWNFIIIMSRFIGFSVLSQVIRPRASRQLGDPRGVSQLVTFCLTTGGEFERSWS